MQGTGQGQEGQQVGCVSNVRETRCSGARPREGQWAGEDRPKHIQGTSWWEKTVWMALRLEPQVAEAQPDEGHAGK